ncbi:MAG: hypothetical protein DIU78_007685 [Pseudomonadota bacterium]
MTVCPRCGTQNAPSTPVCGLCGSTLERPVPKATLVGIAPEIENREREAHAGPAKATLLGISPPTPNTPVPDGEPARHAKTILGLPPPPNGGTPRSDEAKPEGSSSEGALPRAPVTKTLLGVARPGIAPLEPHVPKLEEPQQQEPQAEEPREAPELEPSAARVGDAPPTLPSLAPEVLRHRPPQRIPVLAAFAVTLAAALLAAATVVLLLHRGTGPIEGRAVLGADGQERLEFSCRECPPGTRVRVAGTEAALENGTATIRLGTPLAIGDNQLELVLFRPGESSTRITLNVPVEYRVRAVTDGLLSPEPHLAVVVEALRGSRVVVDGKELTLDARGSARHVLDVSPELTGADGTVRRLSREVPYTVTPPGGSPDSGTVTFQLGIVPLVVDTPGSAITLDAATFVLSGRTQPGATIFVGDRQIPTDGSGRFAQVMSVSSPGETTITVRATAPEHAPRLYPIRVRRVHSLEEEAKRVRERALSSYREVTTNLEQRTGAEVALSGSVVEQRIQGYASTLLVDVKTGCTSSPCLLRVLHGAPTRFDSGAPIAVFGHVTRAVDGPRSGTKVPEVVATFVIGKAL